MKKLLAVLLAVSLMFTLFACANNNTPTSSGTSTSDNGASPSTGESSNASASGTTEKKKFKVGSSYSALDENLTKSSNFAAAAWKQWEADHPGYEIERLVTGANLVVETEMANVESLIEQGCDIIDIMIVDSEGSIPAIEAIRNAGIMCIDSGYIANTDASTLKLLTSDPSAQGMMQAEYVEKYLADNPDVVLNVGWLYGNPAASSVLARHDGVAYLAEKYPDRFHVLEEQYGNWLVADSMAIMEAWLQNYPEMNCIMAASDDMAIGCINVLAEQGKNVEDYLIIAVDGSKSGFVQIEAGKLDATILMAMGMNSDYAVDIEGSLLLGLTVSEKYGIDLTQKTINLGSLTSAIVTKDNIDDMYDLGGVPRD